MFNKWESLGKQLTAFFTDPDFETSLDLSSFYDAIRFASMNTFIKPPNFACICGKICFSWRPFGGNSKFSLIFEGNGMLKWIISDYKDDVFMEADTLVENPELPISLNDQMFYF
jgi:hypothetical protein